jgi:hypothetical protein
MIPFNPVNIKKYFNLPGDAFDIEIKDNNGEYIVCYSTPSSVEGYEHRYEFRYELIVNRKRMLFYLRKRKLERI